MFGRKGLKKLNNHEKLIKFDGKHFFNACLFFVSSSIHYWIDNRKNITLYTEKCVSISIFSHMRMSSACIISNHAILRAIKKFFFSFLLIKMKAAHEKKSLIFHHNFVCLYKNFFFKFSLNIPKTCKRSFARTLERKFRVGKNFTARK